MHAVAEKCIQDSNPKNRRKETPWKI